MKLSQLRCILEVHRHGNHISAAAEALHTSQPGVSKQIQLLEAEIGFPVFQRKRNRVTGLTEPGREVIEIAQRIMSDVENLRTLRDDYLEREQGTLTIATTRQKADAAGNCPLSDRRPRPRAQRPLESDGSLPQSGYRTECALRRGGC
jgi:LysR family cys regulon transcriptional activator